MVSSFLLLSHYPKSDKFGIMSLLCLLIIILLLMHLFQVFVMRGCWISYLHLIGSYNPMSTGEGRDTSIEYFDHE